jgi:hypothetical protein
MCEPKEPHYFSTDFPNFRWYRDLASYDNLFLQGADALIRGEASIMYLYSEEAARNIYEYNPEAKVLIFIRNHADFLRSYHAQQLVNLDEDLLSLEDAWSADQKGRGANELARSCREPAFLKYSDVARFAPQIQRYLDVFPSEQVMVLRFESWTSEIRVAFSKVEEFLGIEHFAATNFRRINPSRDIRSKIVSRLYRNPPKIALAGWRVFRELFKISRGSLSSLLRGINETESKVQKIPDNLRQEIESYFAADREEISRLMERLAFRVDRDA